MLQRLFTRLFTPLFERMISPSGSLFLFFYKKFKDTVSGVLGTVTGDKILSNNSMVFSADAIPVEARESVDTVTPDDSAVVVTGLGRFSWEGFTDNVTPDDLLRYFFQYYNEIWIDVPLSSEFATETPTLTIPEGIYPVHVRCTDMDSQFVDYYMSVNFVEVPIFQFTIKTTSPNESFSIPSILGGVYNFDIDHGDGQTDHVTAYDGVGITHIYEDAGIYTVGITGVIRGWSFAGVGDKDMIWVLSSWGSFDFSLTGRHFYGCSNLTITAQDKPVTETMTSLSSSFRNASKLTDIPRIGEWVTPLLNDMLGTFFNATLFNQNIGSLPVGAVANMALLFTNSGLNSDNYSSILIGFNSQNLTLGVTLDAGSVKYNASASTARSNMETSDNWTINDGGPV